VLRAKVSVFVELYVKNRQLREQAELLRSQLEAGLALDRGAVRRVLTAADGTGPDTTADAGETAGDSGGAGAADAAAGQAGQPDSLPAAVGAQPLLLELSGRLAAVEDLVGVLSAQSAVSPDTMLADCAAQLEHRVGRLRDAFDALRVG
jgi:hypothetical protein